jgi:hypothetical protein
MNSTIENTLSLSVSVSYMYIYIYIYICIYIYIYIYIRQTSYEIIMYLDNIIENAIYKVMLLSSMKK